MIDLTDEDVAEFQELFFRRDFALLLHEWRIDPGTNRTNPNEMTDYNVLAMNAKAFPGTAPLVVKMGERVRIRIGNLNPHEPPPDPPPRLPVQDHGDRRRPPP